MAVVLEKVYVIPTIEAVRTTYQGDIYTVATPGYIDTVVVSGSRITCTCHEGHCDHIRTVERRRMVETTKAACRAAYTELFESPLRRLTAPGGRLATVSHQARMRLGGENA